MNPDFESDPLKLKSMQCSTSLFSQANPESISLEIYFILCLIYIQQNISQTVFASVQRPKPAEFYS